MLKLKLTLIAVILLVVGAQSVSAQDAGTESKAILRKNVIKINPISPLLRNYFFGYERALNDKFTAQLTFGYMSVSATTLPVVGKTIDPIIYVDDKHFTSIDASQIKLTGITIMPEARFYAAHKKRPLPRGFYVGPYLRYQSHKLATPEIKYYNDSVTGAPPISQVLFPAQEIKLTSFGVGLTWGWQAMIGQRVTFEWNMGAGYKSSKLDVPTQVLKDPVTGDDIDAFGEIEKQANDAINTVPIGLRFGFTLGVAF